MLQNIEKVIRHAGVLHIEEARYGSDELMVCLDILTNVNNATDECDGTICYTGTEIYDAVDLATSPGDFEALNAIEKLTNFADDHPEFLYAQGATLDEALQNLEQRAKLWNKLTHGPYITSKEQNKILLDFVAFESDIC